MMPPPTDRSGTPALRRRAALPLLLAALLLGAAGAGRAAPIGEIRPPSADQDLAVIPADAQMVFCVRLAEVWKTDMVQEILKGLPAVASDKLKEAEKEFGLAYGDVERVVASTTDATSDKFLATMTTRKAMDPKKVLEAASKKGKPEEKKAGGETYYAFKAGDAAPNYPMALAFVGDRMLLTGPEDQVKKLLEKMPRKADGPAAAALARAAKAHAVVYYAPTKDQQALAKAQFADDYKLLAETQRVCLAVTVNKDLDLDLTGTYADETTAAEAHKVVEAGRTAVKALLGLARARAADNKDALKVFDAVAGMLNNSKVSHKDKEVQVTTKLEVDVKAIVNLAQMGAIGGGAAPPPADPVGK
jgi:hypothetical protein